IGREAAAPPEVVAPPRPVGPPEREGGSTARHNWLVAGVVAAILAVVAAILWRGHTADPVVTALVNQRSIPLVSVISPGVPSVTSTVTFTGAIAARYDMPIGIEGDAGRIVAVYVEAGDRVKRGQLLAKIDESVWEPQVNRLAASLEQAKAQSALS